MRKVNINAKTIKSRLQSLWLSVTRKSFKSNFWVLQNVFSFRQRQIRKRDRLGFTTLLNKRVSFGRPSEYAYLIRKGEKRLMEFYYGFRKHLLLSLLFLHLFFHKRYRQFSKLCFIWHGKPANVGKWKGHFLQQFYELDKKCLFLEIVNNFKIL